MKLRYAFHSIALSLLVALTVWGQAAKSKPDRIVIKPDSLPKPYHSESARNFPKVTTAPANAQLKLPPGFQISVFAEGDFGLPRWIIEGTNGDLFLSDARKQSVFLLRDSNRDGKIDNATERFTLVEGLNRPFGMAINGGYFYVGNTNGVVRFKYNVGETKITSAPEKIADLPADGYNNHWTRNLLFSPDGKKLYVSVGSGTNVDVESDPRRAAISEYNPDGTEHRIFASGIRNPIGLAWNPTTKELWTAVNERDGLGDDLVPDYATSVKDGGFYGWPYMYIGSNVDPRRAEDMKNIRLRQPIVPDVLLEAHCAALGLVFYTGTMFPKEYQGDAFVAMHGSWNRAKRSGYKVVRIPMKNGKPEGGYENFLTGWVPDPNAREVWGRPVGLTMMRDGSLLVVDDGGNKVWRVTYTGKK
jgi:glucose/arabinose dehydrogenase